MENIEGVRDSFIDKLVEIMQSFYEKKHTSSDGVPFSFTNKPNMQRLKFVVSNIFTQKIEDIPLSDKTFLMDIFTSDMYGHIMNSIFDKSIGSKEFDKELSDFPIRLTMVYRAVEKDVLVNNMRKEISDILKRGENLTKGYFQENKERINKNIEGKIIKITGTELSPILLVKAQSGTYFFLDANQKSPIHTCGEGLEKGYSFNENKLYIFEQKHEFSYDQLLNLVKKVLLTEADFTVGEFFEYIKDKYSIKGEFAEKDDHFLSVGLDVLLENHELKRLFGIINKKGYRTKNIFLDNQKTIEPFGSYDTYSPPEKLNNGYKDKPGVQIFVKKKGKKSVIVTNGEHSDRFKLE